MLISKVAGYSRQIFAAACLWVLLAASAYALEPIQHWQTTNGARVYFVSARELPMVDVRVIFSAGSARDGAHAGLAALTNSLLSQGAGGLSADEIANGFEDLGARYGNSSERDMGAVSLRSLSDPSLLGPAVKLFATVLSRPDFNRPDFDRQRQRMRVAARQRKQRPGSVAKEAFYRAVFGNHPYASAPGGSEASLAELERDQVRDFHRTFYVARNAVVAIVGDLDRAGAQRVAQEIVESLAAGKAAETVSPVSELEKSSVQRITHPSTQSHVMLGAPGMTRRDDDYFALYVGNHILGGSGLVSRLSEEIRDKRGLSYSVYSYFAPMERRGPYRLGLQTRNDQVDEALSVLRDQLKGFVEKGPTQAELGASKKNITGGFPLRIKSNSNIVEYLGMIGFYRLPLDYLDTFNANVEAVTVEKIRDAFRRRVDPDRMATIVVGGGDG
ncbi:MAG: pitrilysin family protein [Gammaproteobacteria bacterium]